MSSLQLRPTIGNCSNATTWVFKAPSCQLPYFGEALSMAVKQGMSVGLHLESRSVVVHLTEAQETQAVRRKLQTIFGSGASSKVMIDQIESMDWFHAESWGLVSAFSPDMPSKDCDTLVEDDDFSEEEPADEPVEDDGAPDDGCLEVVPTDADMFALATWSDCQIVRVPSTLATLDIPADHEKNLRDTFEEGGALTPYLQAHLFARGMDHASRIQEKVRDAAIQKA